MPHMYMLVHLYGDFELRKEQKSSALFSGKSFGHLHTREAVVTFHIPVRQLFDTVFISGELYISGHNVLRVVFPHSAAADPGHGHPVSPEQAAAGGWKTGW